MRRLAGVVLASMVASMFYGPPAPAQVDKRRLGAVVAPVRLVATGQRSLAVGGQPSLFGTVELAAAGDGIVLSNRLSLERYLLGLNEVPLDWPMEALRAQAIAARTYALFTLSRPRAGDAATYGFDICATVSCQVFSGADVLDSEDGARWIEAVSSTEGQTVLYRGAPILARYHSTSGGTTFDNPQIFTTESGYPYLQGVSSTTEEGSPLYRWRVRFSLTDLRAILERAGWWSGGRLLSVRTVGSSAGYHYPDVVFTGEGARLRRTAEELREIVRDLAPAMFPGLYPSPAETSSGILPETFPSNRLDITTQGRSVMVLGRGWGHGVGMSQWGAHGLAQRGASYADILTHYYTGVSVGPYRFDRPIEVGLASGASSFNVSGSFKIVDGRGRTIVKDALGSWGFRWAGPGAIAVDPPQGFGLPLEVGIVRSPKSVSIGQSAYLTIALSRPAKVTTVTHSPTAYRDPGTTIRSAGKRRVVWLAPLEPGRYLVRIRARAGPVARRSEAVPIVVKAPPVEEAAEAAEEALDATDPQAEDGSTIWIIVAVVVLLAFVAIASAITMRR